MADYWIMNSFNFNGLITLAGKIHYNVSDFWKLFSCFMQKKVSAMSESTVHWNHLNIRPQHLEKWKPLTLLYAVVCNFWKVLKEFRNSYARWYGWYINLYSLFQWSGRCPAEWPLTSLCRLPTEWQGPPELHTVRTGASDVIQPLLAVGWHEPGAVTVSQRSPSTEVTL